MSVQSFINSAKILYENENYQEALCLACSAIDACASNKYPNEKNNVAYKNFLKDNFRVICKRGFPGLSAGEIRIKVNVPSINLKTDENGYVGMEQIIYHVLRCGLVHKCDIENNIKFTDNTIIGDWNDYFYIPKNIILGLIDSVAEEK